MTPTPASPRIEQLLAEMTTAEKVGQLTQYFYFQTDEVDAAIARGGVGSVLFVTDPAVLNRLQQQALGGRHGIPLLIGFDVIHGLRTIFPVPIALAASWDTATIERAQTIAAREARAVGIHWAFAPMVDIARDPRWGRIIEGAGEDPLLGGAVAAAQVCGFQGAPLEAEGTFATDRILAGPKHFAGYGAALGGRDYDEADISDHELWNTYLPPFQAAIEAGAANIMSAYMDLNGIPATGNRRLLTDILRDALGFDGFVVSDANSARDLATHHYARDYADAGALALEAGLDMEMAIHDPAFGHLEDAVANGRIPVERLDESVRRILGVKEALGLFEQPFVDEEAAATVLADPAHREAARQAAEVSAVLLRNEDGTLPLDAGSLSTVAVSGHLAHSRRDTLGPWVFDYDLNETVTILDGLRARLDGIAEVTYAVGAVIPERTYPSMFEEMGQGSSGFPEGIDEASFDAEAELDRAVAQARDADTAVVVLGERQDMIGEGASRASLDLPGDQLRLLQKVVATGTPTVLVLMNGRPLGLEWAAEHVPAILDVWYPGTQGGEAVANLLLGDAVPGGKLPFTWPRSVGQVPIHHAVTMSHDPSRQWRRYWDEESTPRYPFGHGLSYASFDYANLSVDATSVGRDGTVTVSVDVTNTSARGGVEVAQLYLHQRYGTSSRPLRQLKGFQRVAIAAGATERIDFTVGPGERRYWNAAARDWVLDASTFDVHVGGSSTAELTTQFTVEE